MKKEMNNKGFSLVELIIVIAIMAVLVGLLAPQYLKFVNNSKVSTDVTNAQEMATAINTAIADAKITADGKTLAQLCSDAGVTAPVSKYSASGVFAVTYTVANGVSGVTLTIGSDTYECYPNPDNSTDGINNTTCGLKQ